LGRVIIPCLEPAVNYVGFVGFRHQIRYTPENFDLFAYKVIYAVRQEFLGHGELEGFTLTCPKGHTSSEYALPSTAEINRMLKRGNNIYYSCKECSKRFEVSPHTLEVIS
jgi:hypothetical protein